jgi:hypothetical protein
VLSAQNEDAGHERKPGPWDIGKNWQNMIGADVYRLFGSAYLDGLQSGRSKLVAWRERSAFLAVGGAIAGMVVGSFLLNEIAMLATAAIGGVIGFFIPFIITSAGKSEIVTALQNSVAKALDIEADHFDQRPSAAEHASDIDLLPSYDRGGFTDAWRGNCEGIPFEMCHALLERESQRIEITNGRSVTRTEWKTVFEGVILSFPISKKFDSTIQLRQAGFLGKIFQGSDHVNYIHPDFNDKFSVYCHDPMSAQLIIHPVMVEKLIALHQEFDGLGFWGVFANQRIVALISGFNPFQHGDIDPAQDIVSLDRIILDWRKIHNFIHSVSEPA